MNLKALNPPLTELPAGQTLFRVQLLRARPGSVNTHGLLLPPAGVLSGGFCLPDPLSADLAGSATTTQPLRLVDRRPLAEPYPVLQSLRLAQTQALARDCFKACLQGLVYASTQHPQHACICLFQQGIAARKRTQHGPRVKPGTRQLLHTVLDAARRSGVWLLGED